LVEYKQKSPYVPEERFVHGRRQFDLHPKIGLLTGLQFEMFVTWPIMIIAGYVNGLCSPNGS